MPRIAAAIGVFTTIAVFTFINIKSFPAVWEMVGAAPWFAQCEESLPLENSSQPEMVTEKDVRETAPSRPKLKSLADNAAKDNGPSSAEQSLPGPAAAYRGLNLGPIKVAAGNSPSGKMTAEKTTGNAPSPLSAPRGSRWAAEMSPRMKYAAKPPILETYQNWNPRRPVVPVKQFKETQKPADDKQNKSSTNARPKPKDPSCCKRPVEQGKGADKAVVRHLPPVGIKDRPIRMSIPALAPDSPISVYPITGR